MLKKLILYKIQLRNRSLDVVPSTDNQKQQHEKSATQRCACTPQVFTIAKKPTKKFFSKFEIC